MGVVGLGCSGLFGDLAPNDEERCYPSCLPPDAASFLVKREISTMPEAVTVSVCRGGACEPAVELRVSDVADAPGGQAPTTEAGSFRYSASHGGPWPARTLVVSVECATCEPFSAGEQVDLSVARVDGEPLVTVRATLDAVTRESPRKDGTVERDCPDVARRTCQELRPRYETLE